MRPSDRPVIVLEAVRRIRPTTNPYIVQLLRSLQSCDGIELRMFRFRRGIFGRYDVVHLHWPELLFSGHRRVGRAARRVLTTALLARWFITRTPIVRTVHNLHRPSDLAWYDKRLLDCIDQLTRVRIRLNGRTPVSGPLFTIPHGHYRDWFAGYRRSTRVSGRVAYVGLIRQYKGVERLIEQFRLVENRSASLVVAGNPTSEQIGDRVAALAAPDGRIHCRLAFLDDADLVATVTEASLVILPYRHMHNSGTVLAALSLDRPVLVPETEVNADLAAEVGAGWIHMFRGELTAEDIERTLRAVADAPVNGAANLAPGRDWATTADAHLSAFRCARVGVAGSANG